MRERPSRRPGQLPTPDRFYHGHKSPTRNIACANVKRIIVQRSLQSRYQTEALAPEIHVVCKAAVTLEKLTVRSPPMRQGTITFAFVACKIPVYIEKSDASHPSHSVIRRH